MLTLPGILLGLTLHELAHGYSAYLMGDPTAKNAGRLTLNPIAHLDPFGFIMLLVAGFGWAKPVPFNPRYFKKYKLGTFVVSIAGVVMNLFLAVLLTIGLGFYMRNGENQYIADILLNGIVINLALAVFNLLPIPPLDGSKIILSFLPLHWEEYYYRYQKYSYVILLGLLYFDVTDYVLFPAVEYLFNLLFNNILIFFV
nr:site-2 protease family protein [Alkaliphilus hydrothermalis]